MLRFCLAETSGPMRLRRVLSGLSRLTRFFRMGKMPMLRGDFYGAALLALALVLFPAPGVSGQMADGRQPVKSALVSAVTAVVPGQPFEVGLLLEMAPGWHTYSEFSGDAGLPTTIGWSLPEGFRAGPIRWPAPHRMIEPGDLRTYGYGEKVLLITTLDPPKDLKIGSSVSLRAKAAWLACKDMCVPGSAELLLDLPVSAASAPNHAALFAEFRAKIPPAEPSPFRWDWELWLALFYGFLGGLILNLMPCVLPVISLKVFGFIRQAGQAPRKIFAHGLAFAGGIFAWFFGLAAVVIVLKSGGGEVTWAFQFQNPWFNAAIGSVVFVFALNLFGVFEIILPGRASNAMASASDGLGGSFFQGVFATLLATPCTAPFLGTALGFAFSQSAAVILAMFAAVAFGMASPYLLLTARPGWMRFLPRPGAWMEKLKQAMGFPLMATLVWILGIMGVQRGADGVIWFLCFLLCLGLACWLYGSFCGPLPTPRHRATAILLAVLVAAGGGWYFLGEKFSRSGAVASNEIAWVPFSAQALSALRADGRSVFVDFTADWCITCKFNERTAINTPAVQAALAEKNIVPMRADWTKANPEITAVLKSFGRVGVPFYVIYPAGPVAQPVILPEILTETILLEALKKIP